MWKSQSISLFCTESRIKQRRAYPRTACAELFGFSLFRMLLRGTVKLKYRHCDERITDGGAIEEGIYKNHACR